MLRKTVTSVLTGILVTGVATVACRALHRNGSAASVAAVLGAGAGNNNDEHERRGEDDDD